MSPTFVRLKPRGYAELGIVGSKSQQKNNNFELENTENNGKGEERNKVESEKIPSTVKKDIKANAGQNDNSKPQIDQDISAVELGTPTENAGGFLQKTLPTSYDTQLQDCQDESKPEISKKMKMIITC